MSESENIGPQTNDSKLENDKATPDPAKSLADQEAILKVQKLQEERDFLRYQNSRRYFGLERLKALSGIGSILVAIFTLGTICFSILKWKDDSDQAREVRRQDQVNKYLGLMQDKSPQQRIYAAIILRSYFEKDNSERNLQIMLALVNQIAFEEIPNVTAGILDVIRSIDFKSLDTISPVSGLNSLLTLNRATYSNFRPTIRFDKKLAFEMKLRSRNLAAAIAYFVQNGILVKDFSNSSLGEMQISNIAFLPNTSFENSDLTMSKFDNVKCQGCKFINANLSTTHFTKCSFQNSDFERVLSSGYVVKSIQEVGQYQGPYFDSTNLSRCNFKRSLLFHFSSGMDSNIVTVTGAKFLNCIFDSVDFRGCLLFTVVKAKARFEDDFYMQSGDSTSPSIYSVGSIAVKAGILQNFPKLKEENLDINTFSGSWKKAILDSMVAKLIPYNQDRFVKTDTIRMP